MGMAASQARLLSITARMTNNENSGQSISFAKQRLADQTQQITNEYNEALNATKLTVLTGFNGADANYTDISYNLMTGLQMAESTRQYIVTDTKGKVLVTNQLAEAFENSKGNYNAFLAKLGYSQSDIRIQHTSTDTDAKNATQQEIHEAWDKYLNTINQSLETYKGSHEEGQIEIGWTETEENTIGLGYTTINGHVMNYEGTTPESRELYDYAMALTESYLRVDGDFKAQYNLKDYKSAADATNNSALKYYRNIFTKMQTAGYFTYTDTPAKANNDPVHYVYSDEKTGSKGTVKKNPLVDNYSFEAALRDGSLRLEYYSTTDKAFKSTTISEDTCIQEVADERAIAKAESKFTQDMTDLENKDKKLDLELKKLDTEHKALETEYESVKNVVNKNVETTFKIFS